MSEPFLKIMNFAVNDLSRNYIKMTRDRDDTKEIIGEVLEKVSLLLAPYAPYITEHIYRNFSKQSVHLSEWPKADKKKIDKKLEENFQNTLRVIEKGLAERDKVQIGLRWPLKSADISTNSVLNKEIIDIIKQQLNVKEIKLSRGEEKIILNTKTTPELEAEGYARELSRQVQAFRKKLGLKKENSVETYIITDDKFKKILENQKDFLRERTNSKKIEFVTTSKERFKNIIQFTIKDKKGDIAVVY